MSLFENISFINEGEQADTYKIRKEAEKDKQEREDMQRYEHRYSTDVGSKQTDQKLQKDYPDGKRSLMNSLKDEENSLKDLGRKIKAQNKVFKHLDDDNPNIDARNRRIAKNSGMSEKEYDRYMKINNDPDYDETEDDIKYSNDLENTDRFRRFAKNAGHAQAYDAVNRHMRRHPKQYKESGIFESVSFINE